MEEVLTIFIGKTVSIYHTKYDGEYPWKRILITDFPFSVFKSLFMRSKNMNLTAVVNTPGQIKYRDLPIYDAITGQIKEKEKVRLIFADLCLNPNYEILENMPSIRNIELELITEKERSEFYFNLYNGLISKMELLDGDLSLREAMRQIENSHEFKKKLVSSSEYFGGNKK